MIEEYEDFLSGSEYLRAFSEGRINDHDTTLLISFNGVQLFHNKLSNCWIYIWGIYDISPDARYKVDAVPVRGFIPGPNAPQNFDSFFYPGLHHLSVLQREGFKVWDVYDEAIHLSKPFLAIGAADGPGATHISGLVGHSGYYRCQTYCPMKGCHNSDENTYCTVHLKPDNYILPGCDHADYPFYQMPVRPHEEYMSNLNFLIASTGPTQFTDRHCETGISKPSVFSGLLSL